MRYFKLTLFNFGAVLLLGNCGDKAESEKVEVEVGEAVVEFEEIGEIDYNEHVRPILSNTCFHCHGPDSETREAGFALHTYEFATKPLKETVGKFGIVPGKPEESEIIQRVYSEEEAELMPPPDSIHKLTARQKHILKEWVKQGAHYKKHWAFIHPKKELPKKELSNPWVKHPIDAFISAKHKQLGMKPSAEAKPEVWLRRVTLSLTGMQPTPQEISAFLSDKSAEAKKKVVDRLLDSPRYGEHMAVAWLEAGRYADTDGYQNDGERQNWPWRDYVIKAFNENKAFDEFTIEQLAGDMLEKPTHEQIIATAWNRNHRQNSEGGALAAEFLVENVLDRVDTVGTTYFGLTMSCARCHDHKYDPISQKEVFQFSSYFNNINENPIGRGTNSQPIRRSLSLFASEKQLQLDVDRDKAQQKINQVLAAQRKSIKKLEPKLNKKQLDQKVNATPEMKAARATLASINKQLQMLGASPVAKVMVMKESEKNTPAYLLVRGQYDAPDKSEALSGNVPAALLGDSPVPKNRLELAQWMMSEKNPITARVLVNRVWQHHFGTGLCSTPEDFGSQAAFPTHPKLLDWLAVQFRESGWDMKRLHKTILLSATYGQSSRVTQEQIKADVSNKWLARGPRFRLSGYTLRDQALHAAGLLNEKLGGPSVKPYQPDGLWKSMSHDPNTRYRPSTGKDLYRRSIYTYWKRAVNPPRQTLFDGSGREICSVTQVRTNTPLQALVLMNDVTFLEAARNLAQKVLLDSSVKDEKRVERVYTLASGYPISAKQEKILQDSYQEFYNYYKAKPEEAKAFITIGASPIDSSLEVVKLATLTAVAHIVLNTDEVLNVE